MKIIHTSDWHLGHSLYNYDRSDEFADIMRQITDIVVSENPDALLISGDLFHTATPPTWAQRMLAETLTELHERCPQLVVIATAGNHDSAARHEVNAAPWRRLGVMMVGSIGDSDNDNCHDRLITEIQGKGFVVAVPYCHARFMPDNLFATLLEKVESRNAAGLPVVIMAHTTVEGGDYTGHKTDGRLVGGIDSIGMECFGSGYDYVALGHIHRPQTLAGSDGRIRYCGTPLAVSFDEKYEHSLSVVEIATHGEKPDVRTIALLSPRALVTIPADGAVPLDEALSMLGRFPDDMEAYIRLNVLTDGLLPADASLRAERMADAKRCRFCLINPVYPARDSAGEQQNLSVEEFKNIDPLEIARMYADNSGIDFTDDMRDLFTQAIDALSKD